MTQWHILGAGALGQWLHQHLPSAHQGRLLARHSRLHSLDRLIICVKAYDLATACAPLAAHLHLNSLTLVVANGQGFEADVRNLPGQVGLVVSTAAAWRDQQGRSRGVTLGQGQLGSLTPEPLRLSPADQGVLNALNWTLSDNIEAAQWQKLALNACINSLTVLLRCRNGELLLAPHRLLLGQLCAELEPLLQLKGLALAGQLQTQAERLCQLTANNLSSSLQDALAHRPTELPYMLTPWLELAHQQQLAHPLLQQLQQQLL